MAAFIAQYGGTIAAAAIIALAVFLIIRSMIKDKKKGKSPSCGGNCSCCSMGCACRHASENDSDAH